MASLNTNFLLAHDKFLPDGRWVVDRVTYSARENGAVPLLVAVSVISLVAVLGLIIALGIAAWETRNSESRNYFFQTNVAVYFAFLLISDIVQSIGSIMNAKWVGMSAVESGNYCIVQGVIKHIADISCGGWSLVIAIHTFIIMFCQVHPPRWLVWFAVVCVNALIVFLCFLGPVVYGTDRSGTPRFYDISGYWCWISDAYKIGQITMDYLIMFISAFFSLILYILVFLRMRGNIVVAGWYVSWRWKKDSSWGGRHVDDRALVVAKHMLLYPVAYSFTIIPIAAARFSYWTSGDIVPFAVTIFCDCIFLLSGLINVLLFCFTRRMSQVLPSRRVLSRVISVKRFNKLGSTGPDRSTEPEATIATFGNTDASLLPDSKRASHISMYQNPSGTPVTMPQGPVLTPPYPIDSEPPRKPPPALTFPPAAEEGVTSRRAHNSRPIGPRPMSRPYSPPGATPPLSRLQFLAKFSPKLFPPPHHHPTDDPSLNEGLRDSGFSGSTLRDIEEGDPENG